METHDEVLRTAIRRALEVVGDFAIPNPEFDELPVRPRVETPARRRLVIIAAAAAMVVLVAGLAWIAVVRRPDHAAAERIVTSVHPGSEPSTGGDGSLTPTSPANPSASVEELLAVPIDQLPVEYSATACKPSTVRTTPGPLVDYVVEELSIDEIVARAPDIVRARVIEVGVARNLTPIDVPEEYLQATGAPSAEELATDSTPITVEVVDTVQGPAPVGASVTVAVSGCWSPNSTALTTVGADVLLFAVPPVAGSGVDEALGSRLRLFDWQEVTEQGVLAKGASAISIPGEFSALEGLSVDDAIRALRDAAKR
jgi:hypothetical protein